MHHGIYEIPPFGTTEPDFYRGSATGIPRKCVVPENIQTPTTEGIGNSRGVGGSEAQEIPEGRGVGP